MFDNNTNPNPNPVVAMFKRAKCSSKVSAVYWRKPRKAGQIVIYYRQNNAFEVERWLKFILLIGRALWHEQQYTQRHLCSFSFLLWIQNFPFFKIVLFHAFPFFICSGFFACLVEETYIFVINQEPGSFEFFTSFIKDFSNKIILTLHKEWLSNWCDWIRMMNVNCTFYYISDQDLLYLIGFENSEFFCLYDME